MADAGGNGLYDAKATEPLSIAETGKIGLSFVVDGIVICSEDEDVESGSPRGGFAVLSKEMNLLVRSIVDAVFHFGRLPIFEEPQGSL